MPRLQGPGQAVQLGGGAVGAAPQDPVQTVWGASSTITPYVLDRLGSVTHVLRPDATLANRYTYNAYGTTTLAASAIKNPFRYFSGYHDGETTGLYKLGIR